eukprot:483488-Pleurochrysis_carterae.AAC.3
MLTKFAPCFVNGRECARRRTKEAAGRGRQRKRALEQVGRKVGRTGHTERYRASDSQSAERASDFRADAAATRERV